MSKRAKKDKLIKGSLRWAIEKARKGFFVYHKNESYELDTIYKVLNSRTTGISNKSKKGWYIKTKELNNDYL